MRWCTTIHEIWNWKLNNKFGCPYDLRANTHGCLTRLCWIWPFNINRYLVVSDPVGIIRLRTRSNHFDLILNFVRWSTPQRSWIAGDLWQIQQQPTPSNNPPPATTQHSWVSSQAVPDGRVARWPSVTGKVGWLVRLCQSTGDLWSPAKLGWSWIARWSAITGQRWQTSLNMTDLYLDYGKSPKYKTWLN
jgi:hypothetical protein